MECFNDEETGGLLGSLSSGIQNPAMFYAYVESRETVGEVYKVLIDESGGCLKYFSPALDTLVLKNCKFLVCGKYIVSMSMWMKYKFNGIQMLEVGDLSFEQIIYDGMVSLLLDLDDSIGDVMKEDMEEAVVQGILRL